MVEILGLIGLAIILFALSRAGGEPADHYRAHIDALGDRIDGQEDIDARERMFDEAEDSFWREEGRKFRERTHRVEEDHPNDR
jgi:hypothetical protein